MKWLDKLERKFGNIYIRNLMLNIVVINAFVYFLVNMSGKTELIKKLMLYPQLVMQGEVWRLITFIFIPPLGSVIMLIFSLYFDYLAGNGLEQEWGGFKFNVYYFVGVIGTIVVSLITGMPATATYINLSLFLAFARIYPNFQVLLFFILPIKVKYIAMLNWAIIIYNFIFAQSMGVRFLILIPVANFLIFFGRDIIRGTTSTVNNYRRKKKFESKVNLGEPFHKCVVCGITEKDDKDMEFRYCSKCAGKQCYCINHIKNHEHKDK